MSQHNNQRDVKVVVIGGGTGSFMVLNALKNYTTDITALVNMADDGGSSGALRDELGALPPGDIRQCLVALSNVPELRDLFGYRFDEGALRGHSFGNLFLTALEKTTGDFGKGVELAADVLNITGRVEPITLDDVHVATQFSNGEMLRGENAISQTPVGIQKGQRFWLEPMATANPRALEAIAQAEVIIIAPGSLYGSLGPALMVQGVGKALHNSKALKVYVCNLVTKPGQTAGYTPVDFAMELERLAGSKFIDTILVNSQPITDRLVDYYVSQDEKPVVTGGAVSNGYDIVAKPLLGAQSEPLTIDKADLLADQRTLIRHDGDAVVQSILNIYKKG